MATLTKHAKAAPRKATRKAAPTRRSTGVSDAAVVKATGKPLAHWFTVLDRFAAGGFVHKDAAAHLHADHALPKWWCQMVTVQYELARGLRARHQRPDGYSVSVSRTVGVPLPRLYAAWKGTAAKLPAEPFTVRSAAKDKCIRLTWADGTSVEVMFYPKGEAKSQVSVQHSKLKSAAAGEKMKRFWAAALDGLRGRLEGAA